MEKIFTLYKTLALALLTALVLPSSPPTLAQTRANEGLVETVLRVPLARGSEISVLVSQRTGTTPHTAVLLFPGYPGILRLSEEAGVPVFGMGGNFLIRDNLQIAVADNYGVVSRKFRNGQRLGADF